MQTPATIAKSARPGMAPDRNSDSCGTLSQEVFGKGTTSVVPLSFPKSAVSKDFSFVLMLLAGLLTFTSTSLAQRTGGMAPHGIAPHAHSPKNNFSIGRNARGFRRSSPYDFGYGSLPFPFLGDNFDPGDIYSTGYPVASEPPPYLMQALQQLASSGGNPFGTAMAPMNTREPESSEPLTIELQNGRYVHVKNTPADSDAEPLKFANSPETPRPSKAPKPSQQSSSTPQMVAAAPLAPVLLIFRDGHSEEVRDYTIADGMLYARGDYYSDGYWTKKIDLAALNVAQTLQANAGRNVKFVLPSSPNEVITRP